MKKAFSILVIVIFLTGAAANADQHLEAKCEFYGLTDSRIVTLDLYELQGEITAVSSLFPEFAVKLDKQMHIPVNLFGIICKLDSKTAAAVVKQIDSYAYSWLDTQLSAPVKGVYAGDLFDIAGSVRCAEVSLSAFTEGLRQIASEQSESADADQVCLDIIDIFASLDPPDGNDHHLCLSIQEYDNGDYDVVRIMDGNNVVMTISVDRSDERARKMLIAYRQEGRYCFRECSFGSEHDQFVFRSNMRTSASSSFRTAAEKSPLFESSLTITDKKESVAGFQYMLKSGTLNTPLIITGQAESPEEKISSVSGHVSIDSQKTELLLISVMSEPIIRPVSFDDKALIAYEDGTGNSVISMAVASASLEVAAWLMPCLPNDYQEMMRKMISP